MKSNHGHHHRAGGGVRIVIGRNVIEALDPPARSSGASADDDEPRATGTRPHRQGRHVRALTAGRWLALVAVCSIAGCHSQSPSGTAPVASSAETSHDAAAAKRIDACSMLTPEDVAALLGVTVQGVSNGTTADHGDCTWTNASTEESVSITIDNAGTAPGNVLPSPEAGSPDFTTPGPDGMRLMGGGGVMFAGGGRSNTIQVAVVRMSMDDANAAAIGLARKIAPKVPE